MATPTAAYVAEVKNRLERAGVGLLGPCGAFQITRRVAWGLRDQGYGLVHKRPEQNGCTVGAGRFAVDVVMLPNGAAWDILVNAETENQPAWNPVGVNPDPALWREPFEPEALGDEPAPPPPPPSPPPPSPPTPPVPDLAGVVRSLQDAVSVLLTVAEQLAKIHEELERLNERGLRIRLG